MYILPSIFSDESWKTSQHLTSGCMTSSDTNTSHEKYMKNMETLWIHFCISGKQLYTTMSVFDA